MVNLLSPENVAFLSMLVSLAAVIIGPIVTFKVARRQVLAPIRQKWIDELRELMSDFLSECRKAIVISEGAGLLNSDKIDEALYRKLLYLENKLALTLNPKESNHIELAAVVSDIVDEVQHGVGDYVKIGGKLDSATTLCQKILKSEWERVKSGGV